MGENAWERRFQARHFCNLALPGLKERFSRGNARSQAGKISLVNLKIWSSHEFR